MCSISIPLTLNDLGGACESCDSCKFSDILEDGMMVCLIDMDHVFMTSPCHMCHLWEGKMG